MVGPQHPEHPSSINRFDAFGDYDYVDTSPPLNAPNFESLRCEKLHEIVRGWVKSHLRHIGCGITQPRTSLLATICE